MEEKDIKFKEETDKKENIKLSSEINVKSEDSISTSVNNIINTKANESESLKVTQEKVRSEFELHIIEAYKILSGFYQNPNIKKINKNKTNINIKEEKNSTINIQLCEKEVRMALNKCVESPNIKLNKNILDKISRIILHNKINILLILGKIFINLMNKEKLFDPLDKQIDLNNIIFFINEICNLNSLLKETYLGNKLNSISNKFMEKTITDFHFEQYQFSAMKNLLNINNEKQKPNKIKLNSLEEMIFSISESLQNQENYYMQYKLIINNYDYIIGLINQTILDEKNNLDNYIELGKIFAYLLYNRKYVIFLKKQSNENEPHGVIKLLFDGFEDNYLLNVVEGEKYYIDYDEEIEEMREKLSELIIKYAEKYKSFSNNFDFQYVLYVLIKRVYFHYYEKFKEKIEPILSEIMINLCFYKIDSIEEIKIFIKEILNSTDKKDNNFKNLLKRKIDFVKINPNFQYQEFQKKENGENNDNNYFVSLENISNETILLLESDLKLGYFINKKIVSGDTFCFYVELTEPYGILDFCVNIEDYNIKLTITNLTEGQEIIKSNEINTITSPFKITLFFSKPVICKFEFDNSYSWIRDKNIKYKVNIFYPQEPFYIAKQILLLKYQETIFNKKNSNNKENLKPKNKEKSGKKMLLVKFDGENKAFNCFEVMQNIETSNKMLEDNYISINSIFIEKNNNEDLSYFYCNKKDNKGELVKYELNKENFINYIKDNILNTSKANIDIINLYIISGDSEIIDNHYISIEEILGFVPDIKVEETKDYNNYKILFFMQYLHQAQMIYSLYKNILNKESYDIILLINYTKYGGYQICLYKDGEILINPNNFKNVNKKEKIEKNLDLIVEEIKKYGIKRRVDIIITESIDLEEKEFIVENIGELIKKKLDIRDEDDSNYKIKKMDKNFNNEIFCNSHIFYLG